MSGSETNLSAGTSAGREVGGSASMRRRAEPEAQVERLTEERDRARAALQSALHERDRAHAALQDAERRKDELLAVLAHELRNPLSPIRSAVQIMRMAEGDQATTAAARTIIERQLKHLVRLIDDLMDVSRITRGKLELRTERIDLAAVLRIAVEINRPLLESRQQHLTIALPEEALVVEADTTRLAQVFANLLNNGAKYSDAGAEIRINATREDARVSVRVRDHGIGIPRDMLERIFDMFTQVDRPQSSPHDGLGVGLTLVKRLVELHSGSVYAESDGPGLGSCFTVRLHLASAPQTEADRLPSPREPPQGALRARILVADDNHDGAQSLALMLGMEGHDVRTASDGLEALRVAEEFRPQLVLLDIGMPKLDGYETARRLRERPWSRGTRLFALTGWGEEEDRERARRAGFDRHLVKPVDPELLSRLLDQALASGRG